MAPVRLGAGYDDWAGFWWAFTFVVIALGRRKALAADSHPVGHAGPDGTKRGAPGSG